MPGVALIRDKLPTEPGALVGNFGIYMAYALVSSGHLPLMNFILLLAFLGEGLVARVAWAEKCIKVSQKQGQERKIRARLLLKGMDRRGQTEPKRRSALIFADSRFILENEAFGKRRLSQMRNS